MSHIVAIVGMTGSGKSVVSDAFVRHGFTYLRFGQITMDILKKKKLSPSEENERTVRENLRREQGMGVFASLNIPKIDALLKEGKNIVIDGLYSWTEYKILKEQYEDDLMVIAVYAPPRLRYQRLTQRINIDEKLINRPATVEQAQRRDYAEIENIEKGGPIAMADYTVINEGTADELNKNIEQIIRLIKGEYNN